MHLRARTSRPTALRECDRLFGVCAVLALGLGSAFAATKFPEVTAPPAELHVPAFYKKFISADGYPIVASERVNDYALKEAAHLVNLMLARRPDVRAAMIQGGSRLCILAHDEFTTDQPEFAWLGREPVADFPQISPKDFWDARARGTGGSETDPYCSSAEENLLGYPGDPYAAECILIHEFAHNIHLRGMVRVDKTFDRRLKKTYADAMKAGLWKGKYASVNHHEYFAEGVQSWFDNNRVNDHDHNHNTCVRSSRSTHRSSPGMPGSSATGLSTRAGGSKSSSGTAV